MSQEARIAMTKRWTDNEKYQGETYTRMPDGVVTKITDWDGDEVDGRSVSIPPHVYVKWPKIDEEERFSTYAPDLYSNPEVLECEDLRVIA